MFRVPISGTSGSHHYVNYLHFFCCLPVQVLLSLTLSIKVNDGIISALTLAATWTFVDGSCPSSCRCLHASCQIGPKTISYLWAVKINEQ